MPEIAGAKSGKRWELQVSFQVTHVGGRDPVLEASPAALQAAHYNKEAEVRNGAGTQIQAL